MKMTESGIPKEDFQHSWTFTSFANEDNSWPKKTLTASHRQHFHRRYPSSDFQVQKTA